ncbi:MAG TPA: hypothetical protein VEU96_22110 [Bryobacteraceae bacterium]|nr:hypothetical protein [Bryobacteraceae bacterium]
MGRLLTIFAVVGGGWLLFGRSEPAGCGTHAERTQEELFLHRQAVRKIRPLAARPGGAALARDIGDIALIDDSNGVVARRNPFDLNQKTLRFLPSRTASGAYRFEVADGSYDSDAAAAGTLVQLGDDDTMAVSLPFAFPFFGVPYQQIYVNSDGNVTFTAGDGASTDRSFGRFTGGLPRIAPLFTDLDPTQAARNAGVYVTSEPRRFIVSWVGVPLYSQFGNGRHETFQLRLFADGRIEIAWSDVELTDAVAGIAPGRSQGTSSVVSFTAGSALEFTASVGERFAGSDSVDIVAAAQQFYAAHEDAYDYLVIFNAEGLAAAPGAVAYEVTTRNQRSGYGDNIVDIGQDFGSAQRLQSVLNLGPLSQYPVDPNAIVPARFISRDTPMTIIGHEAGHLFLAYASVTDPSDPTARPMLGRQLAHWSFLFNSEASFLEGNRIQDNGPGASPRFTTVATVQGYAPLDQYLMGFRAPAEVPPTFLVAGAPGVIAARSPQIGVSFDGYRRDISVQDVIDAVGRRTPDSTVAQRRFRFAFLLVAPAGTMPSASQLAQVEKYRSLFADFYQQAASGRASAETSLRRALHLSVFPATGLINGSMIAVSLALDAPAAAPVIVELDADSGVSVPPYAIIPAGATQASFFMMGLLPGVATITARPVDSSYETAFARVQVADGPASLQARVVSNGPRALVLRVTDVNNLAYPSVVVRVTRTNGILDSNVAISDAAGMVRFLWTGASGPASELVVSMNDGPPVQVALR